MLSNPIARAHAEPSRRRDEDAVVPDCRQAIAGGILHDLNNVFSSLSIAAQLLQDDLAAERRQALLGSLAKATERGQALLEELERHRDREDGESIELDARIVLEAVARAVRRRLGGSRTLETRYEPGLPPAVGDPDELFELVYRLLLHSAATTPEDGSISLACRLRPAPQPADPPAAPAVEIEIEHTVHPPGAAARVLPLLASPALPADARLERPADNRWTVRLPPRLA